MMKLLERLKYHLIQTLACIDDCSWNLFIGVKSSRGIARLEYVLLSSAREEPLGFAKSSVTNCPINT